MDDQGTDRKAGSVSQEIKQSWCMLDVGAEIARVARRFRFSLKTLLIAVTALALIASAYWAGRDRGLRHGYLNGAKDSDSKWQAVQRAAETKHRKEIDQERQATHDALQAEHKAVEDYLDRRSLQLDESYRGVRSAGK
jgi:hypothetical protein